MRAVGLSPSELRSSRAVSLFLQMSSMTSWTELAANRL
jgi:hypothetical protein